MVKIDIKQLLREDRQRRIAPKAPVVEHDAITETGGLEQPVDLKNYAVGRDHLQAGRVAAACITRPLPAQILTHVAPREQRHCINQCRAAQGLYYIREGLTRRQEQEILCGIDSAPATRCGEFRQNNFRAPRLPGSLAFVHNGLLTCVTVDRRPHADVCSCNHRWVQAEGRRVQNWGGKPGSAEITEVLSTAAWQHLSKVAQKIDDAAVLMQQDLQQRSVAPNPPSCSTLPAGITAVPGDAAGPAGGVPRVFRRRAAEPLPHKQLRARRALPDAPGWAAM